MNFQTLVGVLVCLALWGAGDYLAEIWLPHQNQGAASTQEILPLSLRHRAYVNQVISCIPPALDALGPACPPPTTDLGSAVDLPVWGPDGATLRYVLMSMQC
jgi:hypothetical protein